MRENGFSFQRALPLSCSRASAGLFKTNPAGAFARFLWNRYCDIACGDPHVILYRGRRFDCGLHFCISSRDNCSVHWVIGGSNFNNTYDPVQQRAANCTNIAPQADKSNYWQPFIYRVLSNGTYYAMQASTRVYYEIATAQDLASDLVLEPFPFDFQMGQLANTDLTQLFAGNSYTDLIGRKGAR